MRWAVRFQTSPVIAPIIQIITDQVGAEVVGEVTVTTMVRLTTADR